MILNRQQLEKEIANYTFSDYFKSHFHTEHLLEFFEYGYKTDFIQYQFNDDQLVEIDSLQKIIHQATTFSKLESEMARREFIVSPILFHLSYLIDFEVYSEESIYYSDNLRGKLDYLLKTDNHFIIIEAKKNDIEVGGVKQLCMELITLDKIIDATQPFLYGAVTIGTEWGFCFLDRKEKIIFRDLNKYVIPDRLKDILQILLNMLGSNLSFK